MKIVFSDSSKLNSHRRPTTKKQKCPLGCFQTTNASAERRPASLAPGYLLSQQPQQHRLLQTPRIKSSLNSTAT